MTSGAPRSSSALPGPDDTEFHLPPDHWPLPELTHTLPRHADPTTADFVAISKTPEYVKLRATFRRFAFPMTIAGLASYFVYVVLSIYAVDFMATPLIGALNVGMAIGLAQFAVTWIWTAAYVNFATKRLDPTAAALRERLEKGAAA